MSTEAHTPGPWTWRDVSGAGLQISATLAAGFDFRGDAKGADGKTSFMIWTVRESYPVQIADERWVQFSTGSWDEMQRANANLMAAAPDLLAALKEVRHWLGPDLFNTGDIYRDRAERSCASMSAAIARAEGRS